MTAPTDNTTNTPVATTDARQAAIWDALQRRFFTSAGNILAQPVTAGAFSVTVTFPRTEVDTKYGVLATPSWETSVWVTNKTTTSCTINFDKKASAGDTVDGITFRNRI